MRSYRGVIQRQREALRNRWRLPSGVEKRLLEQAREDLAAVGHGGRDDLLVAQGAQRLAGAFGGFDHGSITERGIRGFFIDALENSFDTTWAAQVGLMVPSDTEIEKHRWLGQTPGMREWVGGLLKKGMNEFEIVIENKEFESTIAIGLQDLRRDKIGILEMRMGELGMRANNHWEELSVEQIEANPTGYDGLSFYNTAHVIGESAPIDNALVAGTLPALNVVDPNRVTREEAAAIMTGSYSTYLKYQDDKGKKANQGARSFLFLVPPDHLPGFLQAINHNLFVTGGDNTTSALGITWMAVAEPLLADATKVFSFRTDAPSSRPVILQSEVDPFVDVIGEGSEHAIKTNEILVAAKATRAVALGEFRQSQSLQLS